MSLALRKHLSEKFEGFDSKSDDAAMKAFASEKIKSGDLDVDTYVDLLSKNDEPTAKDKAADLAETIASKTATAVATAVGGQFDKLAEALKARSEPPTPEEPPKTEKAKADPPADDDVDHQKLYADMEQKLMEKLGINRTAGRDGAELMAMAYDAESDDGVRVKNAVERYRHDPQVMRFKSPRAKLMGLSGEPQVYNGNEVHHSTERSRAMSAVWMKFQITPETLTERDVDVIRHILHNEKFYVPNRENDTDSRLLTEHERHLCWTGHKNFYAREMKAAVVDNSGTGGEYATPEFFDMDMIIAPTLAMEDIPSFCNIIPVARGTYASNFILGRPTLAAANEPTTSATPTSVFSATGFIENHDTDFFRAAGFLELGRNFVEDAHPRLVSEIMAQYQRSVRLWLNEQICTGDGTTEPQGIMNASNTNNVTPATPTTGPATLADVLEMLFAVNKEYREDGGRANAIYVMTDLTYSRLRGIATGVTGDTRLVFGDNVEDYRLFNHPVLIEEGGMTNAYMIFAQMKGYRLYQRQGPRFIRESGGDTLTRRNTFLVGCDVRFGGQLDLGGYAAVATGFVS